MTLIEDTKEWVYEIFYLLPVIKIFNRRVTKLSSKFWMTRSSWKQKNLNRNKKEEERPETETLETKIFMIRYWNSRPWGRCSAWACLPCRAADRGRARDPGWCRRGLQTAGSGWCSSGVGLGHLARRCTWRCTARRASTRCSLRLEKSWYLSREAFSSTYFPYSCLRVTPGSNTFAIQFLFIC